VSRFLLLLEAGPCMGSYEVARAPHVLRAVRSAAGKLDVLDLLTDTPDEDEDVYIYQRKEGEHGHVCTRGRGCYAMVTYAYVGPMDTETGELSEVTCDERAWWEEQRMAALRAWAGGRPTPEPQRQGTLL
jgi:hypothetical protein